MSRASLVVSAKSRVNMPRVRPPWYSATNLSSVSLRNAALVGAGVGLGYVVARALGGDVRPTPSGNSAALELLDSPYHTAN